MPFVLGDATIVDCLYRRNDTRNNTVSRLIYPSGDFSSWTKFDGGTGLGFLPQGFAWIAKGGISTNLNEIKGAGFSQG